MATFLSFSSLFLSCLTFLMMSALVNLVHGSSSSRVDGVSSWMELSSSWLDVLLVLSSSLAVSISERLGLTPVLGFVESEGVPVLGFTIPSEDVPVLGFTFPLAVCSQSQMLKYDFQDQEGQKRAWTLSN